MSITPDRSYSIQIFKDKNVEVAFEMSNGIEVFDSAKKELVDLKLQKGKVNNNPQYRVKVNKDGQVYVAKDLKEDMYNMFLSRITAGNIVDAIEDLIILISE